jgi:hypothetical protein
MVSQDYSHAMGLADLTGAGARFKMDGMKGIDGKGWLVAETTAQVPLGLIARENSDIDGWLGILLETPSDESSGSQ